MFNKFGYWKYATNCRKRHIETICEDNSCDEKCENRHPKLCRYFDTYQRCKFGDYCRFKHVKKSKDSNENVKIKIDILEKTEMENKKEIESLNYKIGILENIIDKKNIENG